MSVQNSKFGFFVKQQFNSIVYIILGTLLLIPNQICFAQAKIVTPKNAPKSMFLCRSCYRNPHSEYTYCACHEDSSKASFDPDTMLGSLHGKIAILLCDYCVNRRKQHSMQCKCYNKLNQKITPTSNKSKQQSKIVTVKMAMRVPLVRPIRKPSNIKLKSQRESIRRHIKTKIEPRIHLEKAKQKKAVETKIHLEKAKQKKAVETKIHQKEANVKNHNNRNDKNNDKNNNDDKKLSYDDGESLTIINNYYDQDELPRDGKSKEQKPSPKDDAIKLSKIDDTMTESSSNDQKNNSTEKQKNKFDKNKDNRKNTIFNKKQYDRYSAVDEQFVIYDMD